MPNLEIICALFFSVQKSLGPTLFRPRVFFNLVPTARAFWVFSHCWLHLLTLHRRATAILKNTQKALRSKPCPLFWKYPEKLPGSHAQTPFSRARPSLPSCNAVRIFMRRRHWDLGTRLLHAAPGEFFFSSPVHCTSSSVHLRKHYVMQNNSLRF